MFHFTSTCVHSNKDHSCCVEPWLTSTWNKFIESSKSLNASMKCENISSTELSHCSMDTEKMPLSFCKNQAVFSNRTRCNRRVQWSSHPPCTSNHAKQWKPDNTHAHYSMQQVKKVHFVWSLDLFRSKWMESFKIQCVKGTFWKFSKWEIHG